MAIWPSGLAARVQTVRYYEQLGLLRIPERSEGNQRLYGQVDIDRLALIRHGRALGFPLEAIRDLRKLADDPNQSCEAADKIAWAQLSQVQCLVEQLQALKTKLGMIEQCRHRKISDCRVIEVLSDHLISSARTISHRLPPNSFHKPSV